MSAPAHTIVRLAAPPSSGGRGGGDNKDEGDREDGLGWAAEGGGDTGRPVIMGWIGGWVGVGGNMGGVWGVCCPRVRDSCVRVQELCESRGGRPGSPSLNEPYGF